jgi:hypothetical protein
MSAIIVIIIIIIIVVFVVVVGANESGDCELEQEFCLEIRAHDSMLSS